LLFKVLPSHLFALDRVDAGLRLVTEAIGTGGAALSQELLKVGQI
jgi:hypothetical protein